MRRNLQRYTSEFFYDNQRISFHFWVHDDQIAIDTVVFLGSAQVGAIPKWVSEHAGPGVAIVAGLPHWKAHPSGHDLKQFTEEYSLAAFRAVIGQFGIVTPINVVGISQAVPGTVWLAARYPDKVRNIALVVPLGFTMQTFGDTPQTRLKELKKRVMRNILQPQKQSTSSVIRGLYVTLIILRARFLETDPDGSDNKYAAGLSYDLAEDCRCVLENQKNKKQTLTIFLGEKDLIFPPHEVKAALRKADLTYAKVVVLPKVAHPSFVARHEGDVLRSIVTTVRRP